MIQHSTLDAEQQPVILSAGQNFDTFWLRLQHAADVAHNLGGEIGDLVRVDVRHNWRALDTYTEEELARFCITSEEVPDPPPPVPARVSRLQARKALRAADLLDAVTAAVAQAPVDIQDYWAEASHFHRDHPDLETMRAALGWSSDQLDELFVLAGTMS